MDRDSPTIWIYGTLERCTYMVSEIDAQRVIPSDLHVATATYDLTTGQVAIRSRGGNVHYGEHAETKGEALAAINRRVGSREVWEMLWADMVVD